MNEVIIVGPVVDLFALLFNFLVAVHHCMEPKGENPLGIVKTPSSSSSSNHRNLKKVEKKRAQENAPDSP